MDNFFDIPEKAEVTSVDKNGGRNDKKTIVQLVYYPNYQKYLKNLFTLKLIHV